MTIKLGVVMDPIADIHFDIDTTLGILHAAQERGWEIYYFEKRDLWLQGHTPYGNARLLKVAIDKNGWYTFYGNQTLPLVELDAMLIRLDPPFDVEYLYVTMLLDHAEREGVFVMNRPKRYAMRMRKYW